MELGTKRERTRSKQGFYPYLTGCLPRALSFLTAAENIRIAR